MDFGYLTINEKLALGAVIVYVLSIIIGIRIAASWTLVKGIKTSAILTLFNIIIVSLFHYGNSTLNELGLTTIAACALGVLCSLAGQSVARSIMEPESEPETYG